MPAPFGPYRGPVTISASGEAAKSGGSRATVPRSLADQLRGMDDEALVRLLQSRPDVIVPIPSDLTTMAARLAGRASVQRIVETLDSPALQVLEVLAVLPEPATPAEVGRLWGAPAAPALARLRELALVWGPARGLRLVRSARDLLGPHPAGLGPTLAEALGRRSPQRLGELLDDLGLPPAADPDTALARLSDHLSSADVVAQLLAQGSDGAGAVLDRLTWGPPIGRVEAADRPVRVGDAVTPVEWLLARGLLAVADPGHVVLPREIGLALRGGRVHRRPEVEPPASAGPARSARLVSSSGAAAATEAVRLVEAVGELWSATPPAMLRAGGLGVREHRRAAQALEVDEVTAARVIELGYAAGLLADDGEADPRWGPTPEFDLWQTTDPADRWVRLATAWLATTRCPALVGTRDAKEAVRSPLSADLDRSAVVALRRQVLDLLAETDTDTAPDRESVTARIDWAAPRRAGQTRRTMIGWVLDEAGWLGVTGAGALTGPGRALLTGAPERAADLLHRALPAPVDEVLLQADLTAVATGPLVVDLARELALAADVESRGGATVYRFSAGSVRRALDAGRTGDDLLTLLGRHSRTPVPQPLQYLVQDCARRHGRIRVGLAQAYVRAEDESVLAELLADRRSAGLRLRRLAPTVLAAQAPPATVLEVLRGLGLSPTVESPDGDLVLGRADRFRTPTRPAPRPVVTGPPTPATGSLRNLVSVLRLADRSNQPATAAPDGGPAGTMAATGTAPALAPMDPAGVLQVLRDAASSRRPLWIGYVDAGGSQARRLVEPLTVEAGRVIAFDRLTDEVRTFAVHRVTAVAAVNGTPSGS